MTSTACDDQIAIDRVAVIDDMAKRVSPDQWRQGGSMRYAGHTITWGEYVQRRHEIEEEAEAWALGEERIDRIAQSDASGDHYDEAPCGSDAGACLLNPCGDCGDVVNHPDHYTQGGIECIDALEAATVNKRGIEAVCTANVIKYLWRYESKNGAEDVRKARWYIERLLAALEAE